LKICNGVKTVTVTAGVVSEDFVFAVRVVTALNMSSESSGSADGQGMEGSLMVFERIMGGAEGITVHAYDFGEFVSGFHGCP